MKKPDEFEDKWVKKIWSDFPKLKYSKITGYDKGLISDFLIKAIREARNRTTLPDPIKSQAKVYSTGDYEKSTRWLMKQLKSYHYHYGGHGMKVLLEQTFNGHDFYTLKDL